MTSSKRFLGLSGTIVNVQNGLPDTDLPPRQRPDGRAGTEGEVHIRTCDEVRPLAASIEGWLSDAQGCALFEPPRPRPARGSSSRSDRGKADRRRGWPPVPASPRLASMPSIRISVHARIRKPPPLRPSREPHRCRPRRCGRTARHDISGGGAHARPSGRAAVHRWRSLVRGVRLDADLWLPKLVEGGIVMFHDVDTTTYTGPRRVFRRSICWIRNLRASDASAP